MIGLSLREISRRLGYSVSALSEHQKKGRFKPLKDGSYDLGDVVDGLLAWSDPSTKHRSALEANKAAKSVRSEARPLTPAEQAAEDAAVASIMALLNSLCLAGCWKCPRRLILCHIRSTHCPASS
jgi:hypothetical protein